MIFAREFIKSSFTDTVTEKTLLLIPGTITVVIYFNININSIICSIIMRGGYYILVSFRFIILSLSYQYYACIKKIYIIDIDVYKFQIDNIHIYIYIYV